MADLSWFQYEVEDWTRRVRELGLSYADEGALMRLFRGAWIAEEPCTVRDDPDEFARILGAQWKKALPVIRTHFAPLPEQPKLLRSVWLFELYERALAKHLSYSQRGRLGGRPKSSAKAEEQAEVIAQPKAQVRKRVSSAKPELKAELLQSTTEVLSSAPPSSGHRAKNPASNGALAPVGAALRAADATGGAERSARRKKLEDEYAGRIGERFKAWTARNSDEAASLESTARADLALPDGELLSWQSSALAAAVLQAWRQLPRSQPIPSCDEWVAEREASEWIPDELMAEATS